MRSLTKTRAEVIHSKRRLYERYEISLATKRMEELSHIIKNCIRDNGHKFARFVRKQSRRVSLWFVWYKDNWFPVAFDRKRSTIVTFLPPGYLGNHPDPP